MAEKVVEAEYKPISAFGYVGYNLLFSIPLVGLILLIVYSFDNSNLNRRNYARSFFVTALIGVAVVAIFTTVFSIALPTLR